MPKQYAAAGQQRAVEGTLGAADWSMEVYVGRDAHLPNHILRALEAIAEELEADDVQGFLTRHPADAGSQPSHPSLTDPCWFHMKLAFINRFVVDGPTTRMES